MTIKDLFFTTILATATLSSVQASQYNGFYDEDMALQKAKAASLQQKEDKEIALAIAESLKDISSPLFYNGGMTEDEAFTMAMNASLEDIEKENGMGRVVQHALYASIESANNEINRGNYLRYNPYGDIQEAEMKVAASLAAIKEEQERLKASFIKSCDASLYDIYEAIQITRLAGIEDEEIKQAAYYLQRELTPYMYAFDAYFRDNSQYGIKESINQIIEENPEKLLSAVTSDTGLTTEQVKNIFNKTYGWNF